MKILNRPFGWPLKIGIHAEEIVHYVECFQGEPGVYEAVLISGVPYGPRYYSPLFQFSPRQANPILFQFQFFHQSPYLPLRSSDRMANPISAPKVES